MNDLIDIAKGKVFDYSNLLNSIEIDNFDDFKATRYLRLMVLDQPGVVAAEISKLIAEKNLSIDNLIQKEKTEIRWDHSHRHCPWRMFRKSC